MLISILTVGLVFATAAKCLPLEDYQKVNIVPRAKSYSIVNVDGGSSAPAAAPATTIVEEKTTTEIATVTKTPAAPTDFVTSVTVPTTLASVPTPTSPSSSSTPTPSSSSQQASSSSSVPPASTPAPQIVTIIVTETTGPTEWYDNGMWHTSYAVKSFANVVVSTPSAIATALG